MAFVIIWLVALAVAFFFLVVVPQRRRVAAQRALVAGLEPGDEVITSAGLYGAVQAVDDEVVRLAVAPGVVVRVARGAVIARVGPDRPGAPGLDAGPEVPGPDGSGSDADPDAPGDGPRP
jgi:preprotein translocase subunit YajC